MVLLDHLGPLPPRQLVLQILLIARQGALLHDPHVRGQVLLVQQALDIADPPLQLVDGDGRAGLGRMSLERLMLCVDLFCRGCGVFGRFALFAFGCHDGYAW